VLAAGAAGRGCRPNPCGRIAPFHAGCVSGSTPFGPLLRPLTRSPLAASLIEGIRSAGPFRFLKILAAAALFARMGGARPAWLPGAGTLFAVLAVLHALDLGWRRRRRPSGWREALRTHGFAIGLTVAMATALLVRLPSLGTDLGHVPVDFDEHRLASNVRHFFVYGEIPHETVEHYPGLVFWFLSAASLFVYLRALMSGAVGAAAEIPLDVFMLGARIANVLIAGATVGVTGLLGRQLSGPAAGLVGAFVVAVVPLSVQTTTLVRNDAGQALFTTAAVWAALVLYHSDRRAWAPAAGALAGIAAAIKYPSVFALVPVLLAALTRGTTGERLRRAVLGLAGFAVAVAVTNHFLWSDFPNFVRQLAVQIGFTGPRHWAAVENPLAFYTMMLGKFGPGWPLVALAAAFGVYGLSSRRAEMWIFWAFPLLYVSFMTARPVQMPRWVYPLVPFIAVAGASGLLAAIRMLRASLGAQRREPRRILSLCLTAALVTIVLAPPAWAGIVAFSHRLTPSTHALVEAWLRQNASPGDSVLLEIHWLQLGDSELRVKRVESLSAVLGAGLYQLFATNWIVVPETHFGNPNLRRLSFVRRFRADQSALGGNMGYDFEVYAAPKVAPSIDRADVRLDAPEAAPFLGSEWRPDDTLAPGLRLPPFGASLFLPAMARPAIDVELEVAAPQAASTVPPISLAVDGTPVALTEKPSANPATRLFTAGVRIEPASRATELRLGRVQRQQELRIVRLRIS
jgi:hypothetical protein